MMTGDFGADFLYVAGRRFLATETERQTKSEREGDDDARKQSLDKADRYAELDQGREQGKNPDRPSGNRTEKVRRVNAGGAGRTHDDLAQCVRDDHGHEENEHGHDDLRQVEQDDTLEKDVDLRQTEHVERGDEKGDNYEPFYETTHKSAGIQVETGAFYDIAKACVFKQRIQLDRLDNVSNQSAHESADNPADDYYDNRPQQLRKKIRYTLSYSAERHDDGVNQPLQKSQKTHNDKKLI